MVNQKESENWRPVKGFENNYEVSSFGRFRSKTITQTNSIGVTRTKKGRLLATTPSHTGYVTITVIKQGEKKRTLSLHQQLAITFLGHTPDGYNTVVDHIDGNKGNNRVDNLRIITQRLNSSTHNKRKTSKYIGVSIANNKHSIKWKASIRIEGKQTHIGTYNTPEEASQVYQKELQKILAANKHT